MRSAISRVTTSVLPPGEKGTTIVTGRVGNAGWASAGADRRSGDADRPAKDAIRRRRSVLGMGFLLQATPAHRLW